MARRSSMFVFNEVTGIEFGASVREYHRAMQ